MRSEIDERIDLVDRIMNGSIGKAETEKELDRIATTYGPSVFNEYKVTRKPKPWTHDDLEQLERLSAKGAGSRDFYLYMAEMSEELFKKKKDVSGVAGFMRVLINALKRAASFVSNQFKKHPILSVIWLIALIGVIVWTLFIR